MSLVKVILVTSSFPFLPGEQFIESEMKYWEQRRDVTIRLIPLTAGIGKIRKTPPNAHLDMRLAERNLSKSSSRLIRIFRVILGKGMLEEWGYETDNRIKKLPYMLASIEKIEAYKQAFDSILPTISELDNTVVYCYWHNEACYALQDLKAKYGYKLISRTHRHDLYSAERPHHYMPSKRRYIDNIDSLYALSDSATEYLVREYHFRQNQVKKAGLGVLAREIVTSPSEVGHVQMVSCSNLVEVKRVEIIIDLLQVLSRNKELQIHWTHIGSGPLKRSIENHFKRTLGKAENVSYRMAGELSNDEVFEFYRNNQVDFFINVSRSEGQPVSIMEAMSCSIPIVAPDVGGVSEMLEDGADGIVFEPKRTASDIADHLRKMGFLKDIRYRKSAFNSYSKLFDADKVYPEFIQSILKKV